MLLQRYIRNVLEKNMHQHQQRPGQRSNGKPEGTINVDYIPGKDKKNNKGDGDDDGEYVDYEVVK